MAALNDTQAAAVEHYKVLKADHWKGLLNARQDVKDAQARADEHERVITEADEMIRSIEGPGSS